MAHPRSAVNTGEGESRRSGILLDSVRGRRHRHHLHETVLQPALGRAAAWQGGLPKRASPRPPPLRSRRIPLNTATTSAHSRSCWGTVPGGSRCSPSGR
jgi:hypothetical protein